MNLVDVQQLPALSFSRFASPSSLPAPQFVGAICTLTNAVRFDCARVPVIAQNDNCLLLDRCHE